MKIVTKWGNEPLVGDENLVGEILLGVISKYSASAVGGLLHPPAGKTLGIWYPNQKNKERKSFVGIK